ncbi:MAG: methyltransferase domain-containing protein [Myxococcota bacterium]|nr:methyltransferase domain-containing protein [Myxococcota bacterium]
MDKDEMRAFMGRFMEMTTGAAVLGVVAVADRTGLFRELQGQGPLTLAEIAGRTGFQPRYLEEILATLSAGGILVYSPEGESYLLPDEHAACLADESSPYFLAGWTQMVPALYRAIPGVVEACREGGGVPFSDFGDDMIDGIARSNGPGTRLMLTRKWLPAMPDVVGRLESGIRVADVGCGSGVAALTMARAYPNSEFHGFDVDASSLERARRAAREEGAENVFFAQVDGGSIPSDPGFDFITTFDVIHDVVDPLAVLGQIRAALAEGGAYLMVEPQAGDDLEENLHSAGALTYALSTLHCMTQSLAHGGEGLGAAWGPGRAERYCRDAGFGRFERLELANPFNAFYRIEA